MLGRERQKPFSALVETDELEFTEISKGKVGDNEKGMMGGQEQMHKEAITRRESCDELTRTHRRQGKLLL